MTERSVLAAGVLRFPTIGTRHNPEISVVVPLYNEEENVLELYRRVTAVLEGLGLSYELVLVNDGSNDSTPDLLRSLRQRDPCVVVLHLSRNFGHQPAVSAGIDASRGQAVIVMDGDLQDPPEVFAQFLERWRAGYEVVYAVRRKRKENLIKRAGYHLFYRLLRLVSDLDIPLDSGDFCLMDRRVVEVLKSLPERLRFIRGLRTFVGFRQCGVCYDRPARESGQPKYSFRALLRLAIDGLISFSSFPLALATYLGLFSAGVALVLTLWLLLSWRDPAILQGWTTTVIVVLFMGAAQLLTQGIQGEYIRRIFLECKDRPTYIIREDCSDQLTGKESMIVDRDERAA